MICNPLISKSKTITPTTLAMAIQIALRLDFTCALKVSGLATSCISWFDFICKQHAPKSARDFELTRSSFCC